MRFAQRNISYLRASPRVVLQTILYIDPTHLRWMNSRPYHEGIIGAEDDLDDGHDATGTGEDPADVESTGDEVWARTLNALRYKIMPKLLQESVEGSLLSSTNKKEKVDVHIDKDFQMAYFFQKITGRHAVLLKVCDCRVKLRIVLAKLTKSVLTGTGETNDLSASRDGPACPPSIGSAKATAARSAIIAACSTAAREQHKYTG